MFSLVTFFECVLCFLDIFVCIDLLHLCLCAKADGGNSEEQLFYSSTPLFLLLRALLLLSSLLPGIWDSFFKSLQLTWGHKPVLLHYFLTLVLCVFSVVSFIR